MRLFYSLNDKPKGYYRTGLSNSDIRLAMQGGEWMAVFQVAALVSHVIPPEAKVRAFALHRGECNLPIEKKSIQGGHEIVLRVLHCLTRKGFVEKQGVGRAAKYRWIEAKDHSDQQNQA